MRNGAIRCWLALVATAVATPALADGYMRKSNGDIQFANYPRESLQRGEEGVVGIKVRLDRQARLLSCAVSKSSGYAALDAASCDLLIANARMKPFLNPDGRKVEKEAEGQVVWKLPADRAAALAGSAPPPQTASKAILARAGEKVICKSKLETGSLIKREKVCLTKGEWQRQINQSQEEAQDMKPKFMPGGG
jgi:TonB family protein